MDELVEKIQIFEKKNDVKAFKHPRFPNADLGYSMMLDLFRRVECI